MQTAPTFDIRGCDNYIESMENFHARTIDYNDDKLIELIKKVNLSKLFYTLPGFC